MCRLSLVIAVLGLLIGCGQAPGPRLGSVKGVVKLDNQPLKQARVVFQPNDKKTAPSTAVTSDNGAFELVYNREKKGAIVGTHRVKITTGGVVSDENGNDIEVKENIPAHYNINTELEYEVREGPNEFEIQLDSKKRGPSTPARSQLANPC